MLILMMKNTPERNQAQHSHDCLQMQRVLVPKGVDELLELYNTEKSCIFKGREHKAKINYSLRWILFQMFMICQREVYPKSILEITTLKWRVFYPLKFKKCGHQQYI